MAELQVNVAKLHKTELGRNEGEMTLMQACKAGDINKVKELVQKGAPMDKCGGKTCLEVAIESENRDLAKAIIEHKDWKESLRNPTLVNGVLQSTPFRTLSEKMPDIAVLVLNKCIEKKGSKLEFNFEFVEEFIPGSSDETDTEHCENEHGPLHILHKRSSPQPTFYKKRCHILELMNTELLLHPVVTSLLRWKWTRYIAWFYFVNLGLYLTFVGFLTAFALTVPNPQLEACKGDIHNQTNTSTSTSCGISPGHRSFLVFAAVCTIIVSLLRLLIELFQLLKLVELEQLFTGRIGVVGARGHRRIRLYPIFTHVANKCIEWRYFIRFINYLEVPMYILSIAFVSVFQHECLCPSRGQWQAGIVAVFFAWIDVLLFLNKWPSLGIYIAMLWKIVMRFLKVSIIAVLLLFAFGLAFYMAFYEPDLPDTPFENPGVAFVEAISFAISSPDISIFRLSNDDTRVETIPYPVLSYIIWVVFGVIMSLLFLNFLVGLAVDDVKDLQNQAKKERIILMIQLFKQVEDVVKILNTFLRCLKCEACGDYLNRRKSVGQYSIKYNSIWTKIALLWGDEIDYVIDQLRKRKEEIVDDSFEVIEVI